MRKLIRVNLIKMSGKATFAKRLVSANLNTIHNTLSVKAPFAKRLVSVNLNTMSVKAPFAKRLVSVNLKILSVRRSARKRNAKRLASNNRRWRSSTK